MSTVENGIFGKKSPPALPHAFWSTAEEAISVVVPRLRDARTDRCQNYVANTLPGQGNSQLVRKVRPSRLLRREDIRPQSVSNQRLMIGDFEGIIPAIDQAFFEKKDRNIRFRP